MAFHDVSNPPTEFDHALENFTRNLSQKEQADFRFTTISDVYREIDRIQKDQESKGLLRNLRRLQPFIDGLQRYSSIIEQFVNVKPNILAFIWGPIKLFLQISSTHVKCFDIILNALRRIGENLPRFESFENIFKGDLRIKRVLLWIYSDILEFYAEVLTFLRKKGQYMFPFRVALVRLSLGTTVMILGFPANRPNTPPTFKSSLIFCLSISVRLRPGYHGLFGAPLLLRVG
jgi:hypothetical protein